VPLESQAQGTSLFTSAENNIGDNIFKQSVILKMVIKADTPETLEIRCQMKIQSWLVWREEVTEFRNKSTWIQPNI